MTVLLNMGCYYAYPPCDSNGGMAFPLCPMSCERLSSLVDECVRMVPAGNVVRGLIGQIDCNDTESYLPAFIDIDPLECIEGTAFGESISLHVTMHSITLNNN